MTNQATYTTENFNNNTLFAVILTMTNGETEICSSYYKSEKAANKMLTKVKFWAGA